jgi:hypothetical protein
MRYTFTPVAPKKAVSVPCTRSTLRRASGRNSHPLPNLAAAAPCWQRLQLRESTCSSATEVSANSHPYMQPMCNFSHRCINNRPFSTVGFAGHELPTHPDPGLGSLDIYNIASDTWHTLSPRADPQHGFPGSRSVHGLAPVRTPPPALPGCVALLWHGEGDPSALGHAGAGAFWDDVWALQEAVPSGAREAAAGVGIEALSLAWRKVPVEQGLVSETGEASQNKLVPEGRGWFQPACVEAKELVGVEGDVPVMFGGLLSSNERSGELWALEVVDA